MKKQCPIVARVSSMGQPLCVEGQCALWDESGCCGVLSLAMAANHLSNFLSDEGKFLSVLRVMAERNLTDEEKATLKEGK